ncbi:neutrophil immunoglobulin-like receptor 1 isoform X1 [Grammomys surdaster]|uniref:neutrophil immunoglobulin-like receptor 1 isoform X1 n=1 Tax=Grammomys surdaster TaxID=491861 RepID=UPI0010A01FA2|nr:neutrophil immunoglobulin-like receptor 1 isoform X1 [Grammomys surdaster]
MIFTSTAMLYLGLILGLRSPVLAGNSYRKPRLSVLDSPTVNTGENMTFQCISWQEYDGFILTKEGEPKFSRTLDSQYIFTGHLQAIFYVGPMTPSHSGTYRCYGFYKRNPQKLSMPSDPLEIHVSGVSETINSSEAKAGIPTDTTETTQSPGICLGRQATSFQKPSDCRLQRHAKTWRHRHLLEPARDAKLHS